MFFLADKNEVKDREFKLKMMLKRNLYKGEMLKTQKSPSREYLRELTLTSKAMSLGVSATGFSFRS